MVTAGKVGEIIIVRGNACSEKDNLAVLAKHLLDDLLHEIKALMRNKTRDHCDHRRIGLHGKIEHALQFFFADRLGSDIFCVVVCEQRFIRCGIVVIGIDAVEDPAELEGILTDDVLQAVRIVRDFDLLRVARADRRHGFRAFDRRRH